TFIDSPRLLRPTLQLRSRDDLFMAGQMIGVEGYVGSAAAGLLAGINAARFVQGQPLIVPPTQTSLGSLVAYITDASRQNFQPMNANLGLMPPLGVRARGREKKALMGQRALNAMHEWIASTAIESQSESNQPGGIGVPVSAPASAFSCGGRQGRGSACPSTASPPQTSK
ncbi:MAG TPA: FAD-dependent oxidoreductase, partial [Candidatus Binataceae bacterium]|nr:FAD-dependent oxidoreductase [Candidatus Binataceae bacterium]